MSKLPINITKTYLCNVYPLIPHFYVVKLGYAGEYLFSLFSFQNIDCGYSLKPPRRGGSNVYSQAISPVECRGFFGQPGFGVYRKCFDGF